MIFLEKLRNQGWHLTEEGLKKLTIINNLQTEDVNKIVSLALNWDLKDIAAGALPAKPDSNGTIQGRIVLQIQKMRNISAPKANEESSAAPRFLQLELSDGVNTIAALEFERITDLNLNVPPGTKLFIKSEKITLLNGFIVLKASDVQLLGGKVEHLIEKWELARQMLKYARNNRRLSGSGGPPPWIAFGKRIDAHKDALLTDRNFKSLEIANEKDKNSKENDEFNATRTQAIAEASKAGQKKVFGGGQQNIIDHNVKKILEKGYSEEDAKQALKTNNNNLERALYNLKRKNNIILSSSENTMKHATVSVGRIKDKGGVSSAKEETLTTKPQTNVSLFDFLTDKLPASVSATNTEKSETIAGSTNRDRYSKDIPPKMSNAKGTHSGVNKFENNMSSSFAANRATTHTKSEEKHNIQSRPNTSNRKQDDSHRNFDNKLRKSSERNTSNRTKVQETPNNTKIQNKIPPLHADNTNSTGSFNSKKNERPFGKERDHRQTVSDYQLSKRPDSNNKITEKKSYLPRDVNRNNQDSRNNNNYQQKQTQKNTNFDKDLSNLVNSTSKLTIQNKKDLPSNMQQNRGRNQQYASGGGSNPQKPEQPQKPEHYPNNFTQKSSKFTDSQNFSSKSMQKNAKLSTYDHRIGNGFAYDSSKIVGFQSKEANEYAINMLKSQGVSLQQIQQQQTSPSQPQQTEQISQSAPQQLPQITVLNNQTSTAVAYMTPNNSIFITQAQQAPPQFGMLSGESWPWKEGDFCLAKYWDDGNFYNAKITAISEKTCVVFFIGYGNHEEVLKSDCVPITDAQHLSINPYLRNSSGPPIPQPPQTPVQQRSNMHSGIGCVGNQRYRSERQMYVPPPKRTNN